MKFSSKPNSLDFKSLYEVTSQVHTGVYNHINQQHVLICNSASTAHSFQTTHTSFREMFYLKRVSVPSFFTSNTSQIYVLFSVAVTFRNCGLHASHTCRLDIKYHHSSHKIWRLWKVTRHSSILNHRVLEGSDSSDWSESGGAMKVTSFITSFSLTLRSENKTNLLHLRNIRFDVKLLNTSL